MAPSVREILQESEARLRAVDSPRLSAELLLAKTVGCSRLSIILERDRQLSPQELESFGELVSRRAKGEPIAYLLGEKEFYGLDFQVTRDVLIPRPETEHIIEEVEKLYSKEDAFQYLDLGTGSGILAVTIAKLFPMATGVAVDISPAALDIASGNARFHNVFDRLQFVEGDFTTPLFDEAAFDLVVSNPPYVTHEEYGSASHEVTAFEPVGALVSGADGLDHVRAMLGHVERSLRSGGYFLMEIGCSQGDAVKKIVSGQFPKFGDVTLIKDLASHDRVVFVQKK